jgi:hypothetical protein
MQGRYLTAYGSYPPGDLLSPRFVLGFTLFAAGMAINWQADDILRNLRKPGETGYKIPRVSARPAGVGGGRGGCAVPVCTPQPHSQPRSPPPSSLSGRHV